MSLRSLIREFVALKRRREDEAARDTQLAWMVANLSRAAKIPPLRTLVARTHRRQTTADHRRMLELLSQQYGIPLRRADAH